MWDVVKINVVQPLLGKVGTAVATVLVGYGVNADYAHQVAAGVLALGLIANDLVVDWVVRKRNAQ